VIEGLRRGNRPADGRSREGTDRVLGLCIHLLAILVPLTFTAWELKSGGSVQLTADPSELPKLILLRVLLAVALAAWGLQALRRGRLEVRFAPPLLLLLGFAAWNLLTAPFSLHPWTSIVGEYGRPEGAVTYFTYFLLAFVVVQWADSEERRTSLARSIVIAAAVVSLLGLTQVADIGPLAWPALSFTGGRAFATLANPVLLGGYLIVPLALSWGLALSETHTRMRLIWWALSLLLGAGLLVTFSRGAWLGGIVALALLSVMAVRRRRLRRMDWIAAGGAVALLLTLLVLTAGSANEELDLGRRAASAFEPGSGSAQARLVLWESAWNASASRPLQGWGADTFRLVFQRFHPPSVASGLWSATPSGNAHNYALQVLATTGVVGLALLAGFPGWTLWSSRRARTGLGSVGEACWSGVCGYAVYLLFGISTPGASLPALLALAVLLSHLASPRLVETAGARIGGVIFVLATAVLLAGLGLVHGAADVLAARSASSPRPAEMADSAVRIAPFELAYRGLAAQAYRGAFEALLTQADTANATTQLLIGTQFATAERAHEATVKFAPGDGDGYLDLASLYNLAAQAGNTPYATRAFEVATAGEGKIGPDVRLSEQRALSLILQDRPLEAATLLEGVLRTAATADTWELLGDARLPAGDRPAAIDAYRQALALDPGNEALRQKLAAGEG